MNMLNLPMFHVIRALSVVDGISILRDPLLRGMLVVPIGLAIGVRLLLPEVAARLYELFEIDLSSFLPRFFAYVLLLLPPLICGMVTGFLLLDQRDEQTMRAVRVTPLPLWGYLAHRLVLPTMVSVAVTIAALLLAGIVSAPLLWVSVAACLAAPLAPITALFLAAFAANKVQGFALQKALGVLVVIPALAGVLPYPWPLVAAALPTFWPAEFLRQAAGGVFAWNVLGLSLINAVVLCGIR